MYDARNKEERAMRLYAITGSEFLPAGMSLTQAVEHALRGGADVVQLREKRLGGRELVAVGRELKALCASYGAHFVVNDRADVALLCGADGVHVGQDDLAIGDVRQLCRPPIFVGVSARNVGEAITAANAGADYIGVGPVYPTNTKADAGKVLTEAKFIDIRRSVDVPIVAIGGIGLNEVRPVIHAGADAVAVISAIFAQPDIEEAARSLRLEVDAALAERMSR